MVALYVIAIPILPYYRNDYDADRLGARPVRAFNGDVQHVYPTLYDLPDALNRFLNEIDLSWY